VFIEPHLRPPRSPSDSSKVFPSKAATLSLKLCYHKSFSCNTYGSLRKCVANKRLTVWLSPLDATLTKNTGWGPSASGGFQLPSSLATTLKFFLFIFLRTLLHSRKSQLFYFQAIPHSLPKTTRGGGIPQPVFLTSLPPYSAHPPGGAHSSVN
jgi:hypothetical protein